MLEALKRTTAKNDGDSRALWYWCQKPEDSHFMIQCDVQGGGCKIWYHGGGSATVNFRRRDSESAVIFCDSMIPSEILYDSWRFQLGFQ